MAAKKKTVKKKAKKITPKRKGKKAAKKVVKKLKKSVKKVKKTSKKFAKAPVKTSVDVKNALGIVTHYFPHVTAAVVKVKRPIAVGDEIEITGHSTHIAQRVESMQIDHVAIQSAKKGDEIGLQVADRVREGDILQKKQ